MRTGKILKLLAMGGLALALPAAALAGPIPVGWSCTGNCGTLGPDGVVTAPPGGSAYAYVSTNGGPAGVGQLPGVGGTNGSILTSGAFSASGSEVLSFYFNYVTSDGAGFSDYAWAQLLPSGGGAPIILFDARTTPSGNTVPGFGLPPIAATLVPASTPIIAGGVTWSPLDPNQGTCFDTGCGYTGWIQALFTPVAGNYTLQFGVTNSLDQIWHSGLAIAGATIGATPILDPGPLTPVPEPGTLALLGAGLAALARRRMRKQ